MAPKDAASGETINEGKYNLYTGVSLGDKSTKTLTFTNEDGVILDNVEQLQKTSQTESFDLSGLTFTKPGVYQYTVKENAPASDKEYLIYDRTEYTVYLYVGQENNQYVILSAISANSAGAKTPIKFTNNVKTGSLVVSKTVDGTMGDKDKAFNFTIIFNAHEALGTDAILTGTKTSASGASEEFAFEYNQEKGGYVPTKQLTLSNGEYIRIDGLYRGMVYEVVEDTYSGYTCNVERTKDGTTSQSAGTSVRGTIGTGERSNLEAFTNTSEHTTNTGLLLDYVPYLAALLIVIAGAVLALVSRKRRSER
jgi:pilin isopeptide linkage protein